MFLVDHIDENDRGIQSIYWKKNFIQKLLFEAKRDKFQIVNF